MRKNFLMTGLLLPFLLSCHHEKMVRENRKSYASEEIDFFVENKTGKTIYATCFYYASKEKNTRWQWYKTKVQEIQGDQVKMIDIHTMPDPKDRERVYGALAVFDNYDDAYESIFELLDDKNKIELDQIYRLANKKVTIETELYGFKGEKLDWQIINEDKTPTPELDFYVENKTGGDLWICCFVYQREGEHLEWNFDKTDILSIKNNEMLLIDVDSIATQYDRVNVRGYLGIFKSKNVAQNATFESLKPDQKLALGKLLELKEEKVVLIPVRYGSLPGFDRSHPTVEFEIKRRLKKQHEKSIINN